MTRASGKKHPIAFNNPANDILMQRFHMYYSEKIPHNSEISQLPSEISSSVLSVLQTAVASLTAEQKVATNHTTGPGVAGSAFVNKPDRAMTLSSITYPQSDEKSSFGPILPAFERPNGKREAEK